ncbi:MAG: hypothetical protein ABI759_17680, partial [Candidatus Solibacter sp.]
MKSPGSCFLGSGTGQSPGAATSGSGELKRRVKSPGSSLFAGGGALPLGGAGNDEVLAVGGGGDWNICVNSPGSDAGGLLAGGGGALPLGGAGNDDVLAVGGGGDWNICVNSPGS